MAIIIPIKDDPNHTLIIELESKIFKIWFKFNSVGDFWAMDIFSEDDILLISGIKIIPNYPLIFSNKINFLVSGDFVCEIYDINQRITRNSFSSGKSKLLYLNEVELETF